MTEPFIPELILKKQTKDKISNKRLYRTIQRYNIPTSEQYNNLIKLIHRINTELFNGLLPEVMLSFYKKGGCGKIVKDGWQKDNHKCYEIILNFDITKENHKELLIYLVHTLCHFQQIINNKTSRNSYHNTDFSERMKQMGLSTKSKENNKDRWHTGQKIDIAAIKDGKFEKLYLQLKDEDFLPWQSSHEFLDANHQESKNSKNKIAYKCNKCNTKVWGKSGLEIMCIKCKNPFKQLNK